MAPGVPERVNDPSGTSSVVFVGFIVNRKDLDERRVNEELRGGDRNAVENLPTTTGAIPTAVAMYLYCRW